MKVSRAWLQKYFDTPLPSVEEIADALTFHAFEIEEIEGETLDVKVLPDRAAYGLSHRGIAVEISAILNIPLKSDPLREPLPEWPTTSKLTIDVDPQFVLRHTGALVTGVKVGPSPEWLKQALESVGQRSINNVVDATNYIMLNLGQPAHAFDAAKSSTNIAIRKAAQGEKVTTLTGDTYTLTDKMYVFANAKTGEALDVAGIKGGKFSGVDEKTTDLFISLGNYDGTTIRKTAQELKLFTDASSRFQNRPSPELTAYGMRDLLAMLTEVAGGTLEGVVDIYNHRPKEVKAQVTQKQVVNLLGSEYSEQEIGEVFTRLGFSFEKNGEEFVVTSPFERTDIAIKEDLIEEVGRILGYDRLPPILLPANPEVDQRRYAGIERIKDVLIEQGYSEISTQSFAKSGEIELANPLDVDNPYLRPSLVPNMQKALEHGKHILPLVLPPKAKLNLFEVGTVFKKDGEHISLVVSQRLPDIDSLLLIEPVMTGEIAEYDLSQVKLEELGSSYSPKRIALGPFVQFSQYPFVLRDIALWVSDGTSSDDVLDLIRATGTNLLVRAELFDTFAKDGKTSYAFRLVYQSMDRTLTDKEVGDVMDKVQAALTNKGWQVR
jgi:phenylalanyl-tRNA synthetase beta chain